MEFSKIVRSAATGGDFKFFLEEDGNQLEVSSIDHPDRVAPFNIEFDWLMENKHKLEFAEAFAVETFITQYKLREETKLPVLDFYPKFFFTSDDYEFAELLQSLGLPLAIAIRISYLTSYSLVDAKVPERTYIVKHFFEQKHAVRLQNVGWSAGMTTLEPYILIALNSNTELADKIARTKGHFPDKMLRALADLSGLMRYGLIKSSITDEQINALSSIVTDSFPTNMRRDPHNVRAGAIIELVESISDWPAASIALTNPSEKLSEVKSYLESHLTNEYGSPVHNSIEIIGSLLISTYGEKSLVSSIALLRAHEILLVRDSPYFLSALMAVSDHIAGGGELDSPLDWILALDPSIDQDDLFARKLYTLDDD